MTVPAATPAPAHWHCIQKSGPHQSKEKHRIVQGLGGWGGTEVGIDSFRERRGRTGLGRNRISRGGFCNVQSSLPGPNTVI